MIIVTVLAGVFGQFLMVGSCSFVQCTTLFLMVGGCGVLVNFLRWVAEVFCSALQFSYGGSPINFAWWVSGGYFLSRPFPIVGYFLRWVAHLGLITVAPASCLLRASARATRLLLVVAVIIPTCRSIIRVSLCGNPHNTQLPPESLSHGLDSD